MELDMYQVDAFADRLFTGNPAAVVPLQQWLDADLMQKIAMENNLSETVFFVAEGEQYAIRWFTPEYEIDLCGHATLASAYIIKKFIRPQVSQLTFSTQKAGLLRVDIQDNMYTLNFPSRMPEPCEMPEGLLESLGITSAGPVLRSRDYFVVLPDEEAVLACAPDYAIMKKLP
ncbi:MAG: PhzF family phenazine biosynthesis isomerase, partial [Chitinophagaceae bacterium]